MIKVLNKFEDEGRKTFGTGLRGDARWTGYIGLVMIIVINYLLWRVIMIQLVLLENINEQ